MIAQPYWLLVRIPPRNSFGSVTALCGRAHGNSYRFHRRVTLRHLGDLRGWSRQQAAASRNSPSDESSGKWQGPKFLSWLHLGSVVSGSNSFTPEMDGPALDYVPRYPAPTDDDPDDPDYVAAAAASANLLGPDLHATLDPTGANTNGDNGYRGSDAASLIVQLRQRALLSSSIEEDGDGEREWQSMDIPALLLSPHHASALHSLSSSEEDTSAAPDFADLALAREADRAAQAAAELVPKELQPLARAANLLGFHHEQGRRTGNDQMVEAAGDAPESLDLHLEANRFIGLCEPPLSDEQLEAVAMLVASLDRNGATTTTTTTTSAATEPTGPALDTASTAAGSGGSGGGSVFASTLKAAAAAAAAAALAEEGVEWLDAGLTTAGTNAPAITSDADRRSLHLESSIDLEDRSIQLRRAPCTATADCGMEGIDRVRVAAEAAQELAKAEARVVHHCDNSAAPTGTHGLEGRLVEPSHVLTDPHSRPGFSNSVNGGVAAVAGPWVDVAAAGGRAATNAAAASVAEEAQRAVWGETGWPYSAAMRSVDLVEELKASIQQQKYDSDHGSVNTLLP